MRRFFRAWTLNKYLFVCCLITIVNLSGLYLITPINRHQLVQHAINSTLLNYSRVHVNIDTLNALEVQNRDKSADGLSVIPRKVMDSVDRVFGASTNRSHSVIYDVADIKYVALNITNNVCGTDDVFLVVVVHTSFGHEKNRNAMRQTWASKRHVLHRQVRLVFAVGLSDNPEEQRSLLAEDRKYHDIVQGNYLDSYRNMSYKHVLGLKWCLNFCSQTKFILKLDDDVHVHIFNLIHYLNDVIENNNGSLGTGMHCRTWYSTPARKSKKSKWYVSELDYNSTGYPAYCWGGAMIYTPPAAKVITDLAAVRRYFWIDDVWVSGVLRTEANISIADMNKTLVAAFPNSELKKVILWSEQDDGKDTQVIFSLNRGHSQHYPENAQKFWNKLVRLRNL